MSKRSNTKEFITKAAKINNNKNDYNYADVNYINNHTNVKIWCNNHNGFFFQQPNNHLQGKGCKQCSDADKGKQKAYSTSTFIQAATKISDNLHRYSYVGIDYKDSITKVKIVCKEHGSFYQTPASHLQGRGCPTCGFKRTREALTSNTDDFISKSEKKHNCFYKYNSTKYVGDNTKVKITCPLHGDFLQLPRHHVAGHGCKSCASINNRLYLKTPATLYYIKIIHNNKFYYKIGVTSQTVVKRFCTEPKGKIKISEVQTWKFDIGSDAYRWEECILTVYDEFKTKDRPLKRGGNSEVFDSNVLSL